ncbi:glycoside hydrolase family 16 protein [Pseudonocardia sp. NPDC049635]|uniref:glycoside hydrolase family 16 protein n=1 Tax=Pseudonocardia sp. NPDC049635 TaxID=3155506 RepID=UPI0033D243C1
MSTRTMRCWPGTPGPAGPWNASLYQVGAQPGRGISFALRPGDGGEPEPPDSDEAAVRFGWGAPLPASDEFDTPGLPDPVRWSTYGYDHDANGGAGAHGTWPNPHGNGLRNSQNASVITEGGETFLRLRGDANGDQGAVASRFDQQYGRWEIRARFDRDAATGTRPMNALGIIWPESEVWPEDGEYDFLETPSGAAAAQAWIHYPHQAWTPQRNSQEQAIHPGGIDLTEWHNYGFEWDTDGVRCWVDGEFWYEFSGIGDGAVPDQWPGEEEDYRVAPIQDMPSGHLTLQYDNFADGITDTPQAGTYDIAWARIYPPAARQIGPGAFAGRDRAVGVGDTVTVTGYAGAAATGHAWSIVSGPDRHGETVATTAVAEFTPTLPGTYVLQYAATGGGTSTDRIKVRALPGPESTVRVNLALNPQFGAVPGSGPAMWWGGEQVTVTGVDGVTTGLGADEGECATGRFLVSDSNWHDGDDRITVSVVVIAESATTVTCGVDFYTAVDGGSFIPDGARVSNSTSVECPAGVPTRIVIRDQPRDPGAPPNPVTGEPHPYSLRQPMIVPSNAVAGLVTARSADGVPFVITALMPEAGVDAPTGSPGPGGGQ